MHGLFNRTIQTFLQETYGNRVWADITADAELDPAGFEAMLHYDDDDTTRLIDAAARRLNEPAATLLEDVGIWLVSNASSNSFRRLLRFTGADFTEFLYAVEDLPDRIRLAVPDLVLPAFRLSREGAQGFRIACGTTLPGIGHVLTGLLRAMADDYGALVLLTHHLDQNGESVLVHLVVADYAEGREFNLSTPPDRVRVG